MSFLFWTRSALGMRKDFYVTVILPTPARSMGFGTEKVSILCVEFYGSEYTLCGHLHPIRIMVPLFIYA